MSIENEDVSKTITRPATEEEEYESKQQRINQSIDRVSQVLKS